jgi:hypothetical protein
MSRWPNRIFAAISMLWMLFILLISIIMSVAGGFVFNEHENSSFEVVIQFFAVIGVGCLIWYVFYRIMSRIGGTR